MGYEGFYFKLFPKDSKLDFYLIICVAFAAGFIEAWVLI